MDTDHQVAIVTGSGRNIGRGIALRLAQAGVAVVIHGLEEVEVAQVCREIQACGGHAVGVQADLATPAGAEQVVAAALNAYGRLDILVNNAAVTAVIRPFLELTPGLLEHILSVNLNGALFCALAAARVMAASGNGGVIVNISSVGAEKAHRGMTAYDASKGGLEAATRAMALDLAAYNIRVNAVRPGLVVTDRWEGVHAAELARRNRSVPLGRAATPADIAGIVAFLCSPEAAYITGATLDVDGGLLAQLRPADAEQTPPVNGVRPLPVEEA
jgi:3-oxoacyl-[acyl-carrier protein] reductase